MAANVTKMKATFWALLILRLVSALAKPQISQHVTPPQGVTPSYSYITASTLGTAALCSTESVECKAVLVNC